MAAGRRKFKNDPRTTQIGTLPRVSSIGELPHSSSTIDTQVESLTQHLPSD
jgi:lipopolysaccharide/colanic/teichoic acid biosynthesis glycosyltransferase